MAGEPETTVTSAKGAEVLTEPVSTAVPPNTTPDKSDDETLGDPGKRALDAERKARRDAEARLKELEPLAKAAKDREEAEKTELTKANEALATERDARTSAELKLLRYEIGTAKGVPPKLVPFLAGTTKEQIEAAADALLAELGPNGERPSVPGRPTERMASGKPSSALDDMDPMALVAKARSQDITR